MKNQTNNLRTQIVVRQKLNVLLIIFAFLAFSIFVYISLTHKSLKIDEKNHHLPTLEYIYENGLCAGILGQGYQSANTPLPYIITLLPSQILQIDHNFQYARFINIIISILFFLLLYHYMDCHIECILPLSLIFFYPYLLKTTFVYYQAIFGLLFLILYLIFIRKDSLFSWFLSGLFLSAAILSQQFYLILIPTSLFLFFKRIPIVDFSTVQAIKLIIHFIPLTSPILLFIFWGGLTHPNYDHHAIAFSPTNITSIITILGFTFLPIFVFKLSDIVNNKRIFYFLAVAFLLSIFLTPTWANGAGPGKISGLTFHGLEIISNYSLTTKYLLQVILIISGLEILFQLFKLNNKTLLVMAIFFLIGFSFNVVLSERHLLPLIILVFLSLLQKQSNKLLSFWLPYQATLGCIYFYYLFAYNNY